MFNVWTGGEFEERRTRIAEEEEEGGGGEDTLGEPLEETPSRTRSPDVLQVSRTDRRVAEEDAGILRWLGYRRVWIEDSTRRAP